VTGSQPRAGTGASSDNARDMPWCSADACRHFPFRRPRSSRGSSRPTLLGAEPTNSRSTHWPFCPTRPPRNRKLLRVNLQAGHRQAYLLIFCHTCEIFASCKLRDHFTTDAKLAPFRKWGKGSEILYLLLWEWNLRSTFCTNVYVLYVYGSMQCSVAVWGQYSLELTVVTVLPTPAMMRVRHALNCRPTDRARRRIDF
jgi:hypothetical protein